MLEGSWLPSAWQRMKLRLEILVQEGSLGQIQPRPKMIMVDIRHGFEIPSCDGAAGYRPGRRRRQSPRHRGGGCGRPPIRCWPRVADLRRSKRFRAPLGSGVLVKAPKPGQDRRFDLPSIGPRIDRGNSRGRRLAGLAVIAGGTIIAEPQIVVQKADRAKRYSWPGLAKPHEGLSGCDERNPATGLAAALMRALKTKLGPSGRVSRRWRLRDGARRGCHRSFRIDDLAIVGISGIAQALPMILESYS